MSYAAIDLALRAQLSNVVAATTGSATLGVSAAGFTRASGSFLADGFAVGMPVTATGVSSANAVEGVVSAVSATLLSIYGGRTAQAAASGRTVVAGLPAVRLYDGGEYQPQPGVPYLETELVPEPSELIGGPAIGGTVELRGLFVVRLYGPGFSGAYGLRRLGDAVLERFTPGTNLVAGSETVRIRGGLAPYASAMLPRATDAGHSLLPLTVPWRLYRSNVVASS